MRLSVRCAEKPEVCCGMNKHQAEENLMHLLKASDNSECKLKIHELFGYVDQAYGEASLYAGAAKQLEQELEETREALRQLVAIVEIHSEATGNNFAWAELDDAKKAQNK
jgi:hypothetical protein